MNLGRKLILFFIVFLLSEAFVNAQNRRRIDSLKKLLSEQIHDTIRVKSLNALAKLYWVRKPDTSLVILKEAITIAKKAGDESNLNASYIFLGYTLGATSQFDSALKAYTAGLDLSNKIKNLRYKGMALSGTGNIHYLKGEYQKAVPYYIQALKAQEACGDSAGLCRTYNSLGALFEYQGDYRQALTYHLKSLEIKERLKDVHAVGNSLNNIGIVYMSMRDYVKADLYLQKALKTRRELNDYGGIAMTCSNLGNLYSKRGDLKKAVEHNHESAKYYEMLGDEAGMAAALYNLGGEYLKINKDQKGEAYILQSEEIAERLGLRELLKDIYGLLYKHYSEQGDYKKAFNYSEKYIVVHDSLYNEAKFHEINLLNTAFATEKKEKEIQMLSQQNEISRLDNQKKNQLLIFSAGGIVIVLLLAFVVLRGYMQKRKANGLLEIKNKAIEYQRMIVEQKNEEIMSSIHYAKRIQSALMASERTIGKTLKRLTSNK